VSVLLQSEKRLSDCAACNGSHSQRRRHSAGGMRIAWRNVFGRPVPGNFSGWFAGSNTCYTHTARTAIERALLLLNIGAGDEILAPAYHCGSELDVLLGAGVTVRLFRVSRNAEIDLDDLQTRITSRTRAVYVIHYFGFPQRLDSINGLCRERNLRLIEDCALSSLSEVDGRRIGGAGDVAVYNFPKVLPVPDGGALVINNDSLACGPWRPWRPDFWEISASVLRLVRQSVLAGLPAGFVRLLIAAFRSHVKSSPTLSAPGIPESYYFTAALRNRAISRTSSWLMERMDVAEVRKRRRSNYAVLLKQVEHIPGVKPLLQELPPGVCPLFLAVIVEEAQAVARKLQAYAIPAIAWWAGYHRSFPDCGGFEEARFLKSHLLALPIHQQLDEGAMEFIGEKLTDCMARRGTDL
jgi:perosamine synthetase